MRTTPESSRTSEAMPIMLTPASANIFATRESAPGSLGRKIEYCLTTSTLMRVSSTHVHEIKDAQRKLGDVSDQAEREQQQQPERQRRRVQLRQRLIEAVARQE